MIDSRLINKQLINEIIYIVPTVPAAVSYMDVSTSS
jgi:hypothetical protein